MVKRKKEKPLQKFLKKKLVISKIKIPVRRIRLRPVEEDMFLHEGYLRHPETREPMLKWK